MKERIAVEGIKKIVNHSLMKLEAYLSTTEFKGYDPYDALNSAFLRKISMGNRVLNLVFTHALKRSPVNPRAILGIHKAYNPKGLGLFLTGFLKKYRITGSDHVREMILHIVDLLEETRSTGFSGYCWGYNFDWQSEKMLTKKWTPTIVNTVFIAHALVDAYEIMGESKYLDMARSCCDFILGDLLILKTRDAICFSYTPMSKSKIHNANILGAGLLARIHVHTKEDKLLDYARKSILYTIRRQRSDGAWPYGESTPNEGVWFRGRTTVEDPEDRAEVGFVSYRDSYHTGFVLEGLFRYVHASNDATIIENIRRGLEYYASHFFLEDGTPKYFDNRIQPIDIHCPAQAIVTLIMLKSIEDYQSLLERITTWMIDHMQDRRGYFYYRKGRIGTNRIPYIRWCEAWAFHALTTYMQYLSGENGDR